jgi:DNA mismatch repair protein MutS2
MRALQARSRVFQILSRRRRLLDSEDVEEQGEVEAPIPPVGPAHWVEEPAADQVVDLLNPRPAAIVDVERLRWALGFGFAGGDTGRSLRLALRRAPVSASDWDPSSFEEGLFVRDLVHTCMAVHVEGLEPEVDEVFLARLLTHPPQDAQVVEYRRAILRELSEEPRLRARFQETYQALHRMRGLFESEMHVFEPGGDERRLETLGAIRDAVERMASGFSECESGLARIHRFAERASGTEGYRRLFELLDFDNHLAGVDVHLRVGADGQIRRFDIQRVSENRENRFYQTPLGRLITRIGLLFRGYLFTEGELVTRWVDSVFEGVAQLLPPMLQLLGEMEFYLAGLAFQDLARSKGFPVCFAELRELEAEGGEPAAGTIEGLFNPLLFGQPQPPVSCDLGSGGFQEVTVVTGPNSGGKTRLLQGIAIAQMLAQCGLFAPARAATLGRTSGLFVSLVQEARAHQVEGRLGTELMRIRELFERARPGTLILLDELCSGTNPSEGEEIIRLVISLLPELRPRVYITTHFLQFAARLRAEAGDGPRLRFVQVELDADDCPTYRFRDGVAATSLAHQTAARLGVTREELLALVRRHRSE